MADFADIKGQETAKRLLEVAAVGNHPVRLDGDAGNVARLVEAYPSIGGDAATVKADAPLNAFVEEPKDYDSFIRPSDSSALIRARVEKARKHLEFVRHEADAGAHVLLTDAIAKYSSIDREVTFKVAKSIAALDGENYVRRLHIGEALSYQIAF